jgi:ATP-grasp domain
MIFLDRPYASDFLRATIAENRLPVVLTGAAREMDLAPGPHLLEERAAIEAARIADRRGDLRLYTNSENALGWIAEHLAFTDLPEKVALFKDKARFRELTRSLVPDFFYREVDAADLANLDISQIPVPFIIKPNVGFFSLGVHKINTGRDWATARESLQQDLAAHAHLYPEQVLNAGSFIIEQYVEGREFAVDAYFDGEGQPVILNILEHVFSSGDDVSDRVYSTSRAIVTDNLERFGDFLVELGRLAGVKNFPVHVEIRITPEGDLFPIEVNPLRFGGWCTTADLTPYAFGFNPYLFYLEGQRPDWPTLLAGKTDSRYSIVVLDNSSGIDPAEIRGFDFDRLLATFEKPLELRKIDYRKFNVFGFLFVETEASEQKALDSILHSNLREFILA